MNTIEKVIEETQVILKPLMEKAVDKGEKSSIKLILKDCIKGKEAYDRALFVRLGCEAVGGDWRDVIHVMIAAELMDFSVLVIDDLLDEAPRRMGLPTIYKKYGEKFAIIAASILKSIAVETLLEYRNKNHIDFQKLNKISFILEQAHRQIYIGQYLDILYENIPFEKVTEDMYFEMVKYTTGTQISACFQIGSISGGGKREEINALEDYGLNLGIIFQIRDDLIDYKDDEELIRTVPFLDFQQRKKRWPLLFAYKSNPQKVSKLINSNSIDKNEIQFYIDNPVNINLMRKTVSRLANISLSKIKFVRDKNIRIILEEILNLGTDI